MASPMASPALLVTGARTHHVSLIYRKIIAIVGVASVFHYGTSRSLARAAMPNSGSKLSKPYELPYWSPGRQLGSPQSASQRWKRPPSGGAMLQDFKKNPCQYRGIVLDQNGTIETRVVRAKWKGAISSGRQPHPAAFAPAGSR